MGVVLFSQAQEHTAGNLWFKWVAKKQAKLGVSQGLVSWLFIFYNGSQFGISHTYKITMGYKTRSHGWSKGMVALKVSWSAEQWASSSWVKDRLFSNCWSSISELVQSTRKERSKEKNYIARPKGLALGYSFNLKVSVIF